MGMSRDKDMRQPLRGNEWGGQTMSRTVRSYSCKDRGKKGEIRKSKRDWNTWGRPGN